MQLVNLEIRVSLQGIQIVEYATNDVENRDKNQDFQIWSEEMDTGKNIKEAARMI